MIVGVVTAIAAAAEDHVGVLAEEGDVHARSEEAELPRESITIKL